MSIEAKLVNDDLTINIVDLLSSLTGEQEKQLIEQLSCSEEIIKHISDQIINSTTENGFSGYISCGASVSTALSSAIREVAKASSKLALMEINSLERNLASCEKSRDELVSKYYDLKNGAPYDFEH